MENGIANGIYTSSVIGLNDSDFTGINTGLANGIYNETLIPTGVVTDGLQIYLDAGNSVSYPGSGATWMDLSGKGNNGTITGTLINNSPFNYQVKGNVVFNGTDNYVTTPYAGNNTDSFTFSVWCNQIGNNQIVRGRDGSGNGWSLRIVSHTAAIVNSIGIQYEAVSPYPIKTNTWTNLTGRWISGVSISFFVNGQLHAISAAAGTLRSSTLGWNLATISSIFPPTQTNIASALVYNRALTNAEIAQNFVATKSRFNL